MPTRSSSKGSAGESYAARLLEQDGYIILGRNVHSRWGEVDIIAKKKEVLCFVEVKARRCGARVSGIEAVSIAKQRKILQTALLYMQNHPELDLQPRFDVFTIETDSRGKILSHEHLKGAFDGEAYTDF